MDVYCCMCSISNAAIRHIEPELGGIVAVDHFNRDLESLIAYATTRGTSCHKPSNLYVYVDPVLVNLLIYDRNAWSNELFCRPE